MTVKVIQGRLRTVGPVSEFCTGHGPVSRWRDCIITERTY